MYCLVWPHSGHRRQSHLGEWLTLPNVKLIEHSRDHSSYTHSMQGTYSVIYHSAPAQFRRIVPIQQGTNEQGELYSRKTQHKSQPIKTTRKISTNKRSLITPLVGSLRWSRSHKVATHTELPHIAYWLRVHWVAAVPYSDGRAVLVGGSWGGKTE